MDDKHFQAIALLRFSLIAPVVNNTFSNSSKMAYFRSVAALSHQLPNKECVQFSPTTIKFWYRAYLKHGLDGLLPKRRSDAGVPRVLDNEAIAKIFAIKDSFPYITGRMVYQKLIEERYIKESNASLSSVLRFIRDNNLKRSQLSPVERRAFEMEFANDCWQSDTSHGPKIAVDSRRGRLSVALGL